MRYFKNVCKEHIPFFLAAPALVWQIFLCIIPLLIIFSNSFLQRAPFSLTLAHYKEVCNYVHFNIIVASLFLASITACICLLIGFPVAYWIARHAGRLKNFFIMLLIIPFWTNLLILIYSWLFILEKNGLFNSFLMKLGLVTREFTILYSVPAIILVAVYCYTPFMIMPIFTALEKIDKSLLEASADLGASYRQTLFKVIIPLAWSGIRIGFLLVFIPVFGEFALPLLVGGDRYMFFGNAIAHYVFTAFNLQSASAFTALASLLLISMSSLWLYTIKKFINWF